MSKKVVIPLLAFLVIMPLMASFSFASTVTFDANTGFVEYTDWGWQNYTILTEPDPYCEDCAVFAPLDDLVSGTNTTIYLNGVSQSQAITFDVGGTAQLVTGLEGNAIQLYNASINIDAPQSLTMYDIILTVKLNSKPDSAGTLLKKGLGSPAYDNALLYVDNLGTNGNPRLKAYIGNGSTYVSTVAYELQVNTWYHIRLTWNFGKLTLRIYDENWSLLYEQTVNAPFTEAYDASTSPWQINGKWGYYLNATYDEVRIYVNKILTDKEFEAIKNLGRYRLAYWQGNEPNMPAWLNATLFCALDEMDTVNNVTPCYVNGAEVNATIKFNSTTGYPKLVNGKIGNAFEFDGNSGEKVTLQNGITPNQSITIAVVINIADSSSTMLVYSDQYLEFAIEASKVRFGRFDTVWHRVYSATTLSTNKYYLVIARYDYATGVAEIWIGDYSTGQLWKDAENNLGIFELASDLKTETIGAAYLGTYIFNGVIDEFRLYNRALSDDEIKLLYHINRHKFATLSAPGATYDGSQFLVNVTATLPGDGGSYVLPAPLLATGLTSVGTIGNFTFFDVGTASTVNYQLPVPADLTPPAGVNLLGWMYNNEVYLTGQANQFPVVATVMNLPKGVWYVENGEVSISQVLPNYTKLMILNATSATIAKRYTDLFVEPSLYHANVTVLSKSKTQVHLNVSAPTGESVMFRITNSRKFYPHLIYVDGNLYNQVISDGNGVVEFTYSNWSTHTLLIAQKDLVEYGVDFGVALVMAMIGLLVIDVYVELSSIKQKQELRKVIIVLLVALFAVFLFTLL